MTLLGAEDGKVRARVVGSTTESYEVEFRPEEHPPASHCTCEAWNKYGPHCKHVVATALVYSQRRRAEPASSTESALAEQPGMPALTKLEGWLGLSSLPDYEFIYRLTSMHSASGGRHWIVDVRRADAQGKGPAHVKRLLAAGTRIAPADERVFIELAQKEFRYDARVVLSDEDLAGLLDSLRERRVIYRGAALQFAQEPARPQVQLKSGTDGAKASLGLLLPGKSAVAIGESILLNGRKTFAIVGQVVYPVEPSFPSRLIRKWLLEPSMSFPTPQLDRVLTFFSAHLPRFGMSLEAEGIQVEEAVEPKFLLTVEGGAENVKAQLVARYENTTVPVTTTAIHLGYASGQGPDGSRRLYRRQAHPEKASAKVLLEAGLVFDSASQRFKATGDTAITFWSSRLRDLPKDWEIYAAKAPAVRIRSKIRPKVQLSMSGINWFELDAEFVADDQAVDLGAVRMWLDSGRKYVPLRDGSYAEADPQELSKIAELLDEAGAMPGQRRTRLPLYQASSLALLAESGEVVVEAKAKRAMLSLQKTEGLPKVAVPPGLQGTLRHYQKDGLSWLWFLHQNGLAGILADDMGLGKTVQALALLQKVKDQDGPKPSLVVAPTSVLANWEREAERFVPGLSVFIWHGQDRHDEIERLKHSDLVLTSYALVRRDGEILSEVGFRYVVLDEAQNIKNADSATAQACKSLRCDFRLALTGTPLENRLRELWSIFDFLMPGFLGSLETFNERYEQPIEVAGQLEVRERLKTRIGPFVLRRLKTQVARDLPPKTESIAWCEMEPGQAAFYREVLEQGRRKVYDSIEKFGFKRSRVSILAALMRLRQVCCDPRLLKLPSDTSLPPSAKLERFGQLVEELVAEQHRALVFSQFTEMLELLKQQADQKNIKYLYLDGRTRDRMAKVDAFNDPSGPPLFFISLKAGGTGLNLTAADYVIHYDPWWNPAVEDQATDRAHRIGQTQAVFSYKLITRGTVEEKILALQQRKRELASGVLGGGTELARALTEQDVAELFGAL